MIELISQQLEAASSNDLLTVEHLCSALGVSRATFYRQRDSDRRRADA
jgi:predicted DNA-binding transcriptional regulator AlpA